MKNIILNITLAVAATAISFDVKAQSEKLLVYNEACYRNVSQTVLDGNWAIKTSNGITSVTDKDNNVVRIIVAQQPEKGSSAGCPFTLAIDNCGDLHIINTGGKAMTYTLLPQNNNSDPNLAAPANDESIAGNVKR